MLGGRGGGLGAVVTPASRRNEELESGVTGEDTDIIIIIISLMLGYLTPLTEAPTNIEQYNTYNTILNQDCSLL